MSKKKGKAESFLKPEVSRELDKIKLGKQKTQKIEKGSWPREEKILEQLQRARMKEIQRKILKDEDYNKQKKADKRSEEFAENSIPHSRGRANEPKSSDLF